ncbi:transglutaminase [Agrobacterium vitis]|uniref:transglutaminase-like cysteine peptidase n=1 Tax=Rhizobium/Agrobacterium group TaxID=227290 RepID=UPI0008DBEF0C|nr:MULTISPECIES: transglutaminase-like cysteine peptidase [Rhizobium/Agrobacterium group]MCF1435243.1 transglutaminase [Allorhizobium ampelinum]MCF1448743.1 transglutaminase [Allorhizobium ampelinum]MCF1471575.1 transglutaminase [Allorhizobium ampelinum]MUO89917.1 transglutaminase [Agrobacterium vitis]MUZ53146.1 transglutaminase [Agrobacterium vitis]
MTNKKTTTGFAIIAAIVAFASAQAAFAGQPSMKINGRASQPIGHYEFCQRYASECRPSGSDRGPQQLTPALWQDILAVNYTVNTTIKPETDMDLYGVEEWWEYPTVAGDCEDYALLKRRQLIAKGVDESNLLITVVLQPNGDGHAVLTVRTDRGDFILDNMRNKVLLWSDTEYTFLKRQSSDNPGQWMKIQDGRAPTVAALPKN